MKLRSLLFASLLGVAAASQAQTFNPGRTYKEGAVDSYQMTSTMESSMGEITMSMDIKNTVKKVYENGDADLQTEVSNMTVNVAGREVKPPAGPASTVRVTKYGLPSGSSKTPGGMMGSYFGDKPLTLGQTVNFEHTEANNPKRHSKGTAKLVSLDNGVATVVISIDSWTEASDKPMHMDGTSQVESATGTLIKFEGKATNMPMGGGNGGGMTVTSATIVMKRKA